MINPDKLIRGKGIVTAISHGSITEVTVKAIKGDSYTLVTGYPKIPKGLSVGDAVNIQVQFSIMSDTYIIKTISRQKIANKIEIVSAVFENITPEVIDEAIDSNPDVIPLFGYKGKNTPSSAEVASSHANQLAINLERNRANLERVAKERAQDNESVKKHYRIS